jgi:hypothetical protein
MAWLPDFEPLVFPINEHHTFDVAAVQDDRPIFWYDPVQLMIS